MPPKDGKEKEILMVLKNHVAYRFLNNNEELVMEMLEHTHPAPFKEAMHNAQAKRLAEDGLPEALTDTYALLCNKASMNYIVTNSVLSTLDMLKVTKDGKNNDWSVFKNIRDGRYTFILPENKLLRMFVSEKVIWFLHLEQYGETGNTARLAWVMFYFDRFTGEPCEHFSHMDVRKIEPFVYSLLCFMFLTENDEIELKPGQKTGTKKSGKVINTLSQNLTIVNSRWNTTVIRNEEFEVSGHFRLQRCGKGRENTEIIFIAPFVKKGYIRKAKSEGFREKISVSEIHTE